MNDKNTKQLQKRISEILDAKTIEDLSYVIWTVEFEHAIGSRKSYRESFCNWVSSFVLGKSPTEWSSYKTPEEVVHAIWNPGLDLSSGDQIYMNGIRNALLTKIFLFKESHNINKIIGK